MRKLLFLLPLLWFTACGEDATSPITNRTYAIVLHSPTDGGTLTSYALSSTGLLSDPISSVPAVGSYMLEASAATRQIYTLVDFDFSATTDFTFLAATTLDAATGMLSARDYAAFVMSGSARVSVHPQGKFVYVPKGAADAFLAFKVDSQTKGLTAINGNHLTTGTATGDNPSGSAVHPTGKFFYVSNTTDATISAYTINADTGALAPIGSPTATTGATTPDFMTICPAGKFLYVLGNNQVSAFKIEDNGTLTLVPGSPFPTGTIPQAIRVDPNGKFLYVANNSSANISAFSINADTGVLTSISGSPFAAGGNPISIAFDPTGTLMYVPDGTSKVHVYQIDAATGALTQLSGSPQTLADGPARIEIIQVTL